MKRDPAHSAKPAVDGKPIPTSVLVVFAFVLTPLGTWLATTSALGAIADARMKEVRGMVVAARVSKQERPAPRSIGPWVREWQLQFPGEDGPRKQWFFGRRFRSQEEAEAVRDVGVGMPVWLPPGIDREASLTAPEPIRKAFWAIWSSVLGLMGWLSIVVLLQKARPRTPPI